LSSSNLEEFCKRISAYVGICVVRAVLGLYNAVCLASLADGVQETFGSNAANWYTVFQASQFHMMYYASRTLPNVFALGLSMATAKILNDH